MAIGDISGDTGRVAQYIDADRRHGESDRGVEGKPPEAAAKYDMRVQL
jgi:hypothetical protein